MPISNPATDLRFHKGECSTYECGCLAVGEAINNYDAVFRDNATGLLYGSMATGREYLGRSISCFLNNTLECQPIEYVAQEANYQSELMKLPFDIATFIPTGTQYYSILNGYPSKISSASASLTKTGKQIQVVSFEIIDGVTFGIFSKI